MSSLTILSFQCAKRVPCTVSYQYGPVIDMSASACLTRSSNGKLMSGIAWGLPGKLAEAVLRGARPRAELMMSLRVLRECVPMATRLRLAVLLWGEAKLGVVEGAQCPVCYARALSWPSHPWRGQPRAECRGCGWRASLREVCDASGVDVLMVMSPELAKYE